MKSPSRRLLPPLLLLPATILLSGCTEMDGQINAMKDRIASLRESTNEGSGELQKLNQTLAVTNRQVSAEASKRTEFEARAKKSAATERTLRTYREDLEKSLNEFAASVADYRKKYLAP